MPYCDECGTLVGYNDQNFTDSGSALCEKHMKAYRRAQALEKYQETLRQLENPEAAAWLRETLGNALLLLDIDDGDPCRVAFIKQANQVMQETTRFEHVPMVRLQLAHYQYVWKGGEYLVLLPYGADPNWYTLGDGESEDRSNETALNGVVAFDVPASVARKLPIGSMLTLPMVFNVAATEQDGNTLRVGFYDTSEGKQNAPAVSIVPPSAAQVFGPTVIAIVEVQWNTDDSCPIPFGVWDWKDFDDTDPVQLMSALCAALDDQEDE